MKQLRFTVYMTRVGTHTEIPFTEIISEEKEDIYREFHRSLEWNMWADRNRIYRNVRIEVTPIKGNEKSK